MIGEPTPVYEVEMVNDKGAFYPTIRIHNMNEKNLVSYKPEFKTIYETTLTRVGKDPYTEVYESTTLNNYNVSDAPYLPEEIQTVPVYDKNINVDITLKSSHPAPATLRSMSWEGDYTPKFYQRA